MLFRRTRRVFSHAQNSKINKFYERPGKKELKKLLEAKRQEIYGSTQLKIPGRRGKVASSISKISEFKTRLK